MSKRRSVFSDEESGGGAAATAVGVDVNAVVVDVVDVVDVVGKGFCSSV